MFLLPFNIGTDDFNLLIYKYMTMFLLGSSHLMRHWVWVPTVKQSTQRCMKKYHWYMEDRVQIVEHCMKQVGLSYLQK